MNYKFVSANPVHATSNDFPLANAPSSQKTALLFTAVSPGENKLELPRDHTSQIRGIRDSQKSKEHSRIWHLLGLNLRLTGLLLLQLLELFQF